VAHDITINGLAILNNEPDLTDYYRQSVIGGPGAFVITAADYGAFAETAAGETARDGDRVD
jgi:Protein of unknown function (DUF1194)